MTLKKLPAVCCGIVAATLATAAGAGTDFGTDADARAIADEMSSIIEQGGIDAGIAAMHDSSKPFSDSQMGIHVFEGSVIVADNREPELIATSYAEVADLTDEPMWPRIEAAAAAKGDAKLKWYHYDTEEIYDYDCFSRTAGSDEVIVMVCR